MSRHLLIFSWEYNGYHSVQGTALSKRPRQVAESFRARGWEVTVLHKDHRNESGSGRYHINTEENGIRRIAIRSTDDTGINQSNPLLRKLETLYYIALHGDRTYKWAADVIACYDELGIDNKPDHILSFFSPRVPLFLGNHFSRKLGVPWTADIQDPIYEGVAKKMWYFCRGWMKSVLRSATARVHISPEWAAIDAGRLGMEVHTIRHAIPQAVQPPAHNNKEKFEAEHGGNFNVFYGGSLSPDIQSMEVLQAVITKAAEQGVRIRILLAGNENAYNLLCKGVGAAAVHHLGWLSPEEMNQYIFNCHCTLVVPWSAERIGIPSKFYELCSYPKPIWIPGNDLGAFATLLQEWQHPPIASDNVPQQLEAALRAARGDNSLLFNTSACKGKMLHAADICDAYTTLM
jgi:hypothetical protein